jgi:secreted trypsin-like serine protease
VQCSALHIPGGPLIVNSRIVGIVSWGVTNCVAKGAYSVFTKAKTYVGAAWVLLRSSAPRAGC